ncbi:MAG: Wzz/FepE/Etk N-terminal domain-containing protein [Longimicrobiaceae bacterium]
MTVEIDRHDPAPAHPAAAPARAEPTLSFFQLANVLIRNRFLMVGLPLAFAALMAGMAMRQPRLYTASASFVPNGTADAGSQLSSIAAQLGLNVAGGQPGQSPAFYSELLVSRDILRAAVETVYTVRTDRGVERGNLVHFFGLDDPAAAAPAAPGQGATQQAIEALKGSVNAHVSLETGVVQVTVDTERPALSEAILARLIALTQEFDLTKRRTQASARRKFAEERVAAARADLADTQARLEGFIAHNRAFQSSALQLLEQGKLQQEMLMKQQVYSALSQTYEQARIDEVRNTPVITVLETPAGSATPRGRGTVGRAVVGLVLGAILAAFIALLREAGRSARRARDADFEEFLALRRSLVPWPRRRPAAAGNGRTTLP